MGILDVVILIVVILIVGLIAFTAGINYHE